MKLYYIPGACSLASHIMLQDVGARFEIEAVDAKTKRTQSGQDYHAINANGYVPSLTTEAGDHLNEGVAVLQYIADINPDRAYSPALGSLERARLQQFLNFAAAELHKSWSPLFSDSATEEEQAAAREKVKSNFDYLESVLSDGREYLVAGTFSVADAYTFVLVNWANVKSIDLAGWPKLAAYVARIADRPATKSAFAAEGLA